MPRPTDEANRPCSRTSERSRRRVWAESIISGSGGDSEHVPEAFEQAASEAVHRVGVDRVGGRADVFGQAVAEFLGGFDGEGDGDDGLGRDAVLLDERGDARDDGAGLAGAGAGEHDEGGAAVQRGVALGVVER